MGRPELSLAIAEKKDQGQEEVISSLDKGMLRRMTNDYQGSNQILEAAKQEIEKLYGVSITENLASVTINETLRGYEGDRYEQLLLHAYMAMNYIQLGQLDGARVEMLQANVKMMEWGEEPEEDAFLRYLEGIIYESLGEQDSALVSYRKSYTVYKEKGGAQYPVVPMGLKKDMLRLLAWQGLWSEYKTYKKEFSLTDYQPYKPSSKFGEVVVILNNGLAPIRSETAVPIFSTDVQRNLRVAFPVYREPKKSLFLPQVTVNQQPYLLETVEDIDALANSLEAGLAALDFEPELVLEDANALLRGKPGADELRRTLDKLAAAHAAGRLRFFGNHTHLADPSAFATFLRPLRKTKWFVYAKRPFAGPKAVLAYLSRYTHRIAISNRRLVRADGNGVSFRVKDYRATSDKRWRTMTLHPHEFIRRTLIHVLPKGLHRIRHYGLFASGVKAENLAKMRDLLGVAKPEPDKVAADEDEVATTQSTLPQPCPCCGSQMRIIETFVASCPHSASVISARPP